MAYEKLLDDVLDAWNRQNPEDILSFFTEEMTYIDQAVGVDMGRDAAKFFLRDFIGNYPVGFKVTPTSLCEDPEAGKFAYEWDVEGTSKDGVRMFIRGISMIEMEGDKIRRNVDYWNWAHSPKAKREGNND